MQNKDKGEGIEDSPLDMLLVILLEGASKEVVMSSSKQQLPVTFHLDQEWIKFSTWQCVKEVLCDTAPMDSCHLHLGWAWLRFKTLHLNERSLYLRHEGHQKK